MQVGAGPDGVSPQEQPDAFAWAEGAYNDAHVQDNNDEFSAGVDLAAGQHRYAVRFSGDGGETWTLCDLTGGAFEPAEMGTITPTD